jgi:hypothetical protein
MNTILCITSFQLIVTFNSTAVIDLTRDLTCLLLADVATATPILRLSTDIRSLVYSLGVLMKETPLEMFSCNSGIAAFNNSFSYAVKAPIGAIDSTPSA